MDMLPLGTDRGRAEEFVYGLLTSTIDPREATRLIVSAAGYGNPLHDYFRSLDGLGTLESATRSFSPNATSKSTSGRSELGQAVQTTGDHAGGVRNIQRRKTSGAKQQDYFASCAPDNTYSKFAQWSVTRNESKDATHSETEPGDHTAIMRGLHEIGLIPDNEMTAPIWLCIVCDKCVSSRGVCKRHIEQQHETCEKQQCIGCLTELPNAKKAKRHCKACRHGDQGIRAAPKKAVHGCEYCGVTRYSQDSYVEHLVDHSYRLPAKKPKDRPLKKLRGLLNQPAVVDRLQDLCSVILGSETRWQELDWDEQHVQRAIGLLEQGAVLGEGKERSGQSSLDMDAFLGQLLRVGRLDTGTQRGSPAAKPSAAQQRQSSVGRSKRWWTSASPPLSTPSPQKSEYPIAGTTYQPGRSRDLKPTQYESSTETESYAYLEKSPPVQKPSATKRPLSHFSNLSLPNRTAHTIRSNGSAASYIGSIPENPPPYKSVQEGGPETIAHQPALADALPYAEYWTTCTDNSRYSLHHCRPEEEPATMPVPTSVPWHLPDLIAPELVAPSHNQATSYSNQTYNVPPYAEGFNGGSLELANDINVGIDEFGGYDFDLPLQSFASEGLHDQALPSSFPSEQDNLWTFWRD